MRDMNFRYISEDSHAKWRCLDKRCFRTFRSPKRLKYKGIDLKICPYCGSRELHKKKEK